MTPEEIRAKALELSIALAHVHPAQVIETARTFAEYIAGADAPIRSTGVPAPGALKRAPGYVECTGCGHRAESHGPDGCASTCDYACTWNGYGSSTPPLGQCACGHPRESHRHAGCVAPTEEGVYCPCEWRPR